MTQATTVSPCVDETSHIHCEPNVARKNFKNQCSYIDNQHDFQVEDFIQYS